MPIIPLAAPKIFGRDKFVAQAVSLFETIKPAYLAILGGPGMGKTATALRILYDERLRQIYQKSCYFVPCDGAVSPHLLITIVLRVLHVEYGAADNNLTV